ncbi:hypothetical protein BG004_005494 [Podila humilis]|nr:hypothetical protein BG004_005494 [Podila humilis]
MTLSVYVLFMGIMPVFWASLCDYYGRRPIYLCSNVIFILGSLFAALSRNAWVFFIMRAVQAFGSSSALSVGGGSLSDVFHSGERGQAFGLFYLGPLIAPMVGPFLGGVLSDRAGWRSTMWLLLGTSIVSFLLVLLLLPETYRHRIDEVSTPDSVKADDDDDNDDDDDDILVREKAVARSAYIHSSHSDPTLVASKSSLRRHDQDSSVHDNNNNNTITAAPSSAASSSRRLSVTHTKPTKQHLRHRAPSVISMRLASQGEEGEPAVPSAMEFIVPDYVPPYLMHEDGDVNEHDDTGVYDQENSSQVDLEKHQVGLSHSDSDASASLSSSVVTEREHHHVVFPATAIDTTTTTTATTSVNEKERVAHSIVNIDQDLHQTGTTTATTATSEVSVISNGNNDDNDNDNPLKRKPFNPLRPLLCLLEPTNALLVGFNALALAAQFCLNNTLPITFHDLYHLSETMVGLCFCAGGLGSALGSVLGGRYSDYVMRRWLLKQEIKRLENLQAIREDEEEDKEQGNKEQQQQQQQEGHGSKTSKTEGLSKKEILATVSISISAPPEVRLQSVWIGVAALPFGLMLYGWSVNADLHLAYPLLGIFFSGFGMMMVLTSATTALIDANSDGNMATSAVACNSFARGVMGAVGGFTALPLLEAMGNGWLYTFWAMMTLVGAAGLVLMVFRAPIWRKRKAEKAALQKGVK